MSEWSTPTILEIAGTGKAQTFNVPCDICGLVGDHFEWCDACYTGCS